MKSSKVILALWLGTSAWAQILPQNRQVNPAVTAPPKAAQMSSSSSASPKSSVPAVATNSKVPGVPGKPVAAPSKTVGTRPNQPASASSARISAKSSGRPNSKSSAQSAHNRGYGKRKISDWPSRAKTQEAAKRPNAGKGQRDPFVSPVVERFRGAASCTGTGRQCLVVDEITLHGVVSSPSGFIAVVMNGEHTYFLREKDPLANGAVERITKDTIILRERSSDFLGRPSTREVTKKLGVPAV
jgi:hypothetical protein